MADQCSGNQIFDPNIQKCIGCRDQTANPVPDYLATVPRGSGLRYTCANNPIITYDGDNKVIGRTCDSGEIFSDTPGDYKCILKFFAKK